MLVNSYYNMMMSCVNSAKTMYETRNYILENDDVHAVIHDMFKRVSL